MAKSKPKPDAALREALKKAYLLRARLFVSGFRERQVDSLIAFLDLQSSSELTWNLEELAIDASAFRKVKNAGFQPHLVFCHPDLLQRTRQLKLLDYYRNLAALSQKGLAQLTEGMKGEQRARARAQTINGILSALVNQMTSFDLALARSIIPLEIGAELQGAWVNTIGKGAASQVEKLITDFVTENGLQARTESRKVRVRNKQKTEHAIVLTNDWRIIFADEPDIAIRDPHNVLRVAMEIKGSLDKAGAQTRYGEARKSFGKALAENAQCETIYLGSCFTEAVIQQIRKDREVRKYFNLIDILTDDTKRQAFLTEIFTHQIRII